MLKFVCFRFTKKKLRKRLSFLPLKDFRELVNPIIAANRKISLINARNVKTLQTKEVIQILDELGEPSDEYGKLITLPSAYFKKQHILTKIPEITNRDIAEFLNPLISNKNKRHLKRHEVIAFLNAINELDIT